MGTNYYRIPTHEEMERKKEQLIKDVQELSLEPSFIKDSFGVIPDGYDKMSIWDKFTCDTLIHLGNRSGGWKFLWNFHDNGYYANKEELLTFITRYISVPLPPPIKQEDFNDLVKVGIKEDNREALWRLAVNYDKKMNFTLIEDYFIDKRDSYYLIELISATDSVNLDNIVSKVVATNDREFMIDLENRSLELSIFTKDDIDKIKEKYNL